MDDDKDIELNTSGRALFGCVHTCSSALRALAVLLTIGYATTAWPAKPMHFEHLSLESGLSQNAVLSMLQDSQGFMWIGTENGLNRYDGNTVVRYFHDPRNSESIGSDYIWDLAEDAHGNVWAATNSQGIQVWLRDEGRFMSVPIKLPSQQPVRSVSSLELHSSGEMWVGTSEAGVFLVDTSDMENLGVRQLLQGNRTFAEEIKSISIHGETAFVGAARGLFLVNIDNKHLLQTINSASGREDKNEHRNLSIAFGNDQTVWVASKPAGLWNLHKRMGAGSYQLRKDFTNELNGDVVQTVFSDSSGRIWVGTQTGLLLYNSETDQFDRHLHDPANPSSLASNYVLSIYEDRSGLIWVGTRGGGASRWNPRTWALGEVTHPSLDGAVINAFSPRADGQTWIGTIGSGLILHDEATGAFERFTRRNGFADLPDQRIMSLLSTSDDDLWIGTLAGGLHRYNFETQALQSFRRGEPSDTLGADGIMSLHESADGTVWAGTFGGGMAEIDPTTNQVKRYTFRPDDSSTVPSSRVTAFADADGDANRVWVGTLLGGLALLDRESGEFLRISADGTGLDSGTVYSLHKDGSGGLWAGTAGGGLLRLTGSPTQPRIDSWSTPQGFSSNVIYGIQPDAEGQLWLSSNDGVMRFNPETAAVDQFHRTHGLHSEEFNFNAHAIRADGKLYFGGNGGYNAFDPLAVERNAQAPQLVLTGLELLNEPADLGTPYPQVTMLALGHRDDVITFEFAALDFASPDSNLYSYQLEGFDRNWSLPSTRNRATYTNLDGGKYTFRVRAANSDGAWTDGDHELRVGVTVTPPPWATWWAYVLYVIAAGLLTWSYIRSRIRRAEAAERLRQLTFYDRATGLPNRDFFEQRLRHILASDDVPQDGLSILCLQAFGLNKAIDALGFQTANSAMTMLASRISQVLIARQVGIGDAGLARIGDQTFALLLQSDNATTASLRMGDALIEMASHPIKTPGQEVTLSPAVGIATVSPDVSDAEQLINSAVLAATQATQQPNNIAVYSNVMSVAARDQIALERDLAEALDNNTLALYVQPKYNAAGLLIGGEALLRWHHPTRGWISPEVFVAIAEQTRLGGKLNAWVVQRAVSFLDDWQKRKLQVVPVAINVSSSEYVSANIVELLHEQTSSRGIAPKLVEVEITESVLLSDLEAVEACLNALRTQGHSIALDDFGTGYSSMQYLQRLSIDTIKIDRSFVDQVDQKPDQAAICQAIIALAKSLDMNTVAEGVETQAQQDLLLSMGCSQFQGFHYSEALPPAEFAKLLDDANDSGA